MTLLYGNDEELCDWASRHLFGHDGGFKQATAIGIMRSHRLIAAVVYSNYKTDNFGDPLSIEMSIASVDKHWCSRHNLRALFKYPFAQLQLKRVQALCSAKDEGTMRFLERLGFTEEGYHPSAYSDGSDAVSYGMLKCRWL